MQKPPLSQENHGRFEPACSVVICTHDRPKELERCLEAIAHLCYPRFDVLVVDNAPSDSQARQVAARRGASYLVEPARGVSRARNRGVRSSNAEIIAFCDDDAVPEPEWLAALACEFQDPLVMAVTGRAIKLGAQTAEGAPVPTAGSHPMGNGRVLIARDSPFWFEISNFGGIGDGYNMAFRRRAFELWPGFDERLGRGALINGGEEHQAFFSLVNRGYRVAYTPHAVVHHTLPHDLEKVRRRNITDAKSAASYIAMMLVEQPRYRRAFAKYALEGLRGVPRVWRDSIGQASPLVIPRWRLLLAWLSGPWLYLWSRLKQRRPQDPPR